MDTAGMLAEPSSPRIRGDLEWTKEECLLLLEETAECPCTAAWKAGASREAIYAARLSELFLGSRGEIALAPVELNGLPEKRLAELEAD